jgi:alpha-galactosidase
MKRTRFLTMVATLIFPPISWAQHNINDGQWKITFNEQAKTLTYSQNGKEVVKGAYIEIHKAKTIHDNKAETLLSTSYPTVSLSNTAVADAFGNGTKYTYTYSGLEGKDNIEQSIYIYPGKNYLLVEAALVAKAGETKANYIAPVVSKTASPDHRP